MRAVGGRLIVDAPHGAVLRGIPAVDVDARPLAGGGATMTLRIGRNVTIGRRVAIELRAAGTNVLEIGSDSRIYDGVRFELRGGSVVLRDEVKLRNNVAIKCAGRLEIGEHVLISFGTVIHCDEQVTIGAMMGIAEHSTIIDSDHDHDGSDDWHMRRPLRTTPIEIGENVLISRGVAILRGTKIGHSSVVAANAVLNGGEFPPRHVIGGIPARVLKPLPAAERDAPAPAPGAAEPIG